MEKKTIFVIVFICVIIGMIILTLSLRATSEPLPSTDTCSVGMGYLPVREPLFLRQNNSTDYINAFILPNSNGLLAFKTGDKFNVACPGDNNYILVNGTATTTKFQEVQCEKGVTFKILGKSIKLYEISCFVTPKRSALETTMSLCGKHKEISIGFDVSETVFIKHLLVCFDDALQNSLYTHQILSASISGGRNNLSAYTFIAGGFYKETVKVDELYKIHQKTVNKILGLPEDDKTYFQNNNTLSRGHYSAKADFFYGSQQTLTYYYVNAAPQWYTFNSGNWKTMEIKCREFASAKNLDLDIYTGSHGISKLPNKDEILTELYLYYVSDSEKGIPVPRIYYRVVYDAKSKSGVAFVGVNNPHMIEKKKDIICEDVCDKITWIGTDWNRKDMESGYLYCCDIDSLRKTVEEIPPLTVESLLV